MDSIEEHIGRSEEFMRHAERRFEEFSLALKEIKESISVLPALKADVESMKPEVARWVTARKGFYFMLFLFGSVGTYLLDPFRRLFG